ncbi:hypothetical protein GCM10023149_44090 [Mucilaginibacter gynuensis]|uniref:Knr4/Smi1-like domain-containing protein n=1 Tax=Mucilaginibacter gynuensis TaxID=1302236 RepID=A0ABP8H8E4_9SPHI
MSISEIITYLKTHIGQTDITLYEAAPIELINKFETTFNVKLPDDIKEFYLFCNGFESDEDLFRIIPLDEMIEYKGRNDDHNIYIAEYLIYSNAWQLEVNDNSYRISNIDQTWILTRNFAEFLDRFLKNGLFKPNGLYDWSNEVSEKRTDKNQNQAITYKTPSDIYRQCFIFLAVSFAFLLFKLITGGSEISQNGFGYLLLLFFSFILILFGVSIYTTIAYKEWFKRNRYINISIFLFSLLIIGLVAYSIIVNGGIY